MKILITGGAGFIGSHLARYCQKHGHSVAIIDKDYTKHKMTDIPMRWSVDLTDYGTSANIEMAFNSFKPDVCFHLAAYASEGRSNHIREYITRNNTLTTMRIINLCVKHDIKLVFTSSVAVLSGDNGFEDYSKPRPIDEYGVSKYTSEMSIEIAAKTQGLRYTIIRPRNVYGPGQNMWDPSRNLFGIWFYNALHGKPCLIYGDGSQARQFTYIDDLIPSLSNASSARLDNWAINLGGLKIHTVAQAAEAFTAVTGYADFKHVEPRHEVKIATCTTGLAEHYLGWDISKETPLRDGLKKMALWAQEQRDLPLDQMPTLEVDVNAHSSLK